MCSNPACFAMQNFWLEKKSLLNFECLSSFIEPGHSSLNCKRCTSEDEHGLTERSRRTGAPTQILTKIKDAIKRPRLRHQRIKSQLLTKDHDYESNPRTQPLTELLAAATLEDAATTNWQLQSWLYYCARPDLTQGGRSLTRWMRWDFCLSKSVVMVSELCKH